MNISSRNYNFGSSRYVECFGDYPSVDHMDRLRSETIEYMEKFDPQSWYSDPVCTVIDGKIYTEGTTIETPDAFENPVGKLILASPSVVDLVIEHAQSYRLSGSNDLRAQIRAVESAMLGVHAPVLVGNQALDFKKQDGITEIEESLEANPVEQRMNDQLFADEVAGKVDIKRNPALIGCVSNFSNFLDLCRKSLRNLELGIPIIILSRSNTTQHMYRWAQLLMDECVYQGIPTGMITYASCSIEEQRRIMKAIPDSPLYLTGSRPVAAAIKDILPATF